MRGLAIATLAALAACSGSAQKVAQNLTSSAPAPVKDALLAATIAAKFATIDLDSSTAVHVGVAGGTVTLTGQVRSAAVRSRFDGAARSTSGVKTVDDRTSVNPKLRSLRESVADAALLTKVSATLVAQTGINALKVKPGARNGVVTLSGVVPSGAIKATMLESVRKLNGVRLLVDRIAVQR